MILVSASASKINSCPLTSNVPGVSKLPDSFALVTDASEGVTVPPTAPDISTMKILAPLAGAVLNVICVPPVAKV